MHLHPTSCPFFPCLVLEKYYLDRHNESFSSLMLTGAERNLGTNKQNPVKLQSPFFFLQKLGLFFHVMFRKNLLS
jgi:hypothetical protein